MELLDIFWITFLIFMLLCAFYHIGFNRGFREGCIFMVTKRFKRDKKDNE